MPTTLGSSVSIKAGAWRGVNRWRVWPRWAGRRGRLERNTKIVGAPNYHWVRPGWRTNKMLLESLADFAVIAVICYALLGAMAAVLPK